MKIDRFALCQGGLSSDPMFSDRIPEVRALNPRVIRLFVQEYYDILPVAGEYDFTTLDASVDLILKSGATPLLSLVLKPRVLFPKIDQTLVVPTSWEKWNVLISKLVDHYKVRNGSGWYWEVGNEWNRPDGGGTPFHMTPQQYTEFYQNTVAAIRRADPQARVGGPAQGYGPPVAALIPALLSFCDKKNLPLDFVSWHIYPDDPREFRRSITSMRDRLSRYPRLHPELVIDEWNMGWNADRRIQPAYVAEATFQMMEAELDISCYYQIRDYPFAAAEFRKFYPATEVADQILFWNRRPVGYGLFDYQNRVRPAYFSFLLLQRLTGERIELDSGSGEVHGLASVDRDLDVSSILLWNYSAQRATVDLNITGLTKEMQARRFLLNVDGSDYNQNLCPLPTQDLPSMSGRLSVQMDPWAVTFVSLEEL